MSTVIHQFGGDWTEDKLNRLRKYLSAYTIILTRNLRAQFLSTYYVDAFAGSGSRTSSPDVNYSTLKLFDDTEAQNVETFYDGSARVALEIDPPFDHYLFIETDPAFVEELRNLRSAYPARAHQIEVVRGDANASLQNWCRRVDWRRNRAVVFLDPYGMAVNWQTIETLGNTEGVDLWVLLPIGQAINRMLTRQGLPNPTWSNKLTTFFGTDAWQEAFYRPSLQASLFDDDAGLEKQANFESIGEFFAERLRTVFPEVADNSLMLMNSRNVPIFGLYFAASHPVAAKIANDILGR